MSETRALAETDMALVCGRLEEFFARRSPWHRRLWNVGTTLALREVAEYAAGCLDGRVPSIDGLKYVVETARREAERDPGVAHLAAQLDLTLSEFNKSSVKGLSSSPLDDLRHLIRRAEDEYCERWCQAPAEQPVEFVARALASHLLDAGLSSDHLYRWLQRHRDGFGSLAALTDAIAAMDSEMRPRGIEVFVPCAAQYVQAAQPSGDLEWKSAPEASAWLSEHAPRAPRRRQNGGFVVRVVGRDPWAAIEAAQSILTLADARARIARIRNRGIELSGWAWVKGSDRCYELRAPQYQVEVGSLDRQRSVYRFDGALATELDDALQLASYMASSSPGAAVTGGWAAIEGLLIRAGEQGYHQAADRLAALITCSFPRAEMTPLAYAHVDNGADQLAVELQQAPSNHARVCMVEEHLLAGNTLTLSDASDLAAQERLRAVLREPAECLQRIQRYVSESLRRLYNQRNVIAHSGSFRSAALTATARTSFALVGAGLDRIVHAQLANAPAVPPLDLVARAETELRLVGSPGGRRLSSLLE